MAVTIEVPLVSRDHEPRRVASPLVVYERSGQSSVANSLLLDEASETATTGPKGP